MNQDTEIKDLIDKYKSIEPRVYRKQGPPSASDKKDKLFSQKKEAILSYERLKTLWMQTRSKDHLNSLALIMEKLNDIDRYLLSNGWL